MNNLNEIVQPLLQWYQENKRKLPWREEKDPYKVWISEIMLQQTRIEAVKEYYRRFMTALPTVQDLANVNEEMLLKLWQGLGYYNRARNLQKAAKIIEKQYNGKIPNTYQKLVTLPGIGEYTAGAIASISYNEKVTAVDGNVLRVISRIIGNKKNILDKEVKEEITKMVSEILPKESGDFNEALMELGEVICLPNQEPLCSECPLKVKCYAYQNHLTKEIPVREKKMNRVIEEKTVMIFITNNNKIALQKRKEKGLLAGMYEFPNIDGKLKLKEMEELLKKWKIEFNSIENLGEYKHIFTHKTWEMHGYKINVIKRDAKWIWVSDEELQSQYPIPNAFNIFLKRLK